MGLDIYAGTLTRYYTQNWKTAVQQFGEAHGIPVQIIRANPEEHPADEAEVLERVTEWRKHILNGLGITEPPLWNEDANQTPYYTDKPDWDGITALQLFVLAKMFGQKKGAEKKGEDTSALEAQINANMAASVKIDEEIAEDKQKLKELDDGLTPCMLSLPTMPDPDLLPGGKENNQPLRYIGEKHSFDFEPKHHVDLCQNLGLIDYERGVKLAGAGNWIYTGMGARLEWALLNYFIDCHVADGYEFILPPHMLEYQCGLTAGQFPKFADEVYKIANPTDDRVHYMLPTAEAALASVYRDEILTEADLPKKFFAYTPCFRREAGSHRADERGMVRGHQFNTTL